jgi:hypothetical protein
MKKFTGEKNYIFFIKSATYFSLRLHKGRLSYRRSLRALKENIQLLKKNMKFFFNFFYFCGSFLPSWFRIRIYWSGWFCYKKWNVKKQEGDSGWRVCCLLTARHLRIFLGTLASCSPSGRDRSSLPYEIKEENDRNQMLKPVSSGWRRQAQSKILGLVNQKVCCNNFTTAKRWLKKNISKAGIINFWHIHSHAHPLKAGHKAGNFSRPNYFPKGRFSGYRPRRRPAGNRVTGLERNLTTVYTVKC